MMRWNGLLALAMVASVTSVGMADDAQLDRGHRILRERGLQIAGWVFPLAYNTPNGPFGMNLSLFDQSGFTLPAFHGIHRDGSFIAPGAGVPWGKQAGPRLWPNSEVLFASERPYLNDLMMFQYEDEIALDAPSYWNANETFADETAQWMAAARSDWAQNVILHNNIAYYHTNVPLIQQYMAEAQPDMLVFDHYSADDGTPRWQYLHNNYQYLETYRALANAGHDGTGNQPIPAGKYIQLFENAPPHHRPSESEQWFDTFQAWTFGYKAVIAYSYNSTVQNGGITDSLLFDDNFPDQTVPTDRFYVQAEINRQSLNLGPALVSLWNRRVYLVPGQHKGGFLNLQTIENPIPGNMLRWAPENIAPFSSTPQFISGVNVTNLGSKNNGLDGDVLVSYSMPLVETDDGDAFFHEWYFMVTNGLSLDGATAAETRQLIRLDFDFRDSGIDSLIRLSRLTGEPERVSLVHDGGSNYHLELTLDGGVGDLFKFGTAAPFVGILQGDSDVDGDVDLSDLSALAAHYGQTGGVRWGDGDFDLDGDVDLSDLSTLAAKYGAGESQALADFQSITSVPEPSAFVAAVGFGLVSVSRLHGVAYRSKGATIPPVTRASCPC
jgi:hypothetical protein